MLLLNGITKIGKKQLYKSKGENMKLSTKIKLKLEGIIKSVNLDWREVADYDRRTVHK